jgi:hypothetical protein
MGQGYGDETEIETKTNNESIQKITHHIRK